MKVTFPVLIDSIRTLKDRSVKIVLETREFSPDESAILFSLRGSEAWALLSPAPLEEDDIPDEPVYQSSGKSPSQRLRNVLYVLWQQKGSIGEFDTFYRERIEGIIAKIKEKLE